MTSFPKSRREALDFRPRMRTDLIIERFGNESATWAPRSLSPVYLDGVATLLMDVIDGEATVTELSNDISAAVGVPVEAAEWQVLRVLEVCRSGELLDLTEGYDEKPPSLFRASDPPDY